HSECSIVDMGKEEIDVKNSPYYKNGIFNVPMSEDSGNELYQHWADQAFSSLMAALATERSVFGHIAKQLTKTVRSLKNKKSRKSLQIPLEVNLFSPSLFSLHSQGNGIEQLTSLPNLLKSTGVLDNRDQQDWMDFVIETSGAGDVLEKAKV
ncbi:hypothetical protein TELCIR_19158, partial [Teladorsagia circumcincta]